MSDFLLDNPGLRKLIMGLGLPIPVPQPLRRADQPYSERPLGDRAVVVGAASGRGVIDTLAETLAVAGANSTVIGDDSIAAAFKAPGEAYGRPATRASIDEQKAERADALVFDATTIADPSALRAVFEFFGPLVRSLQRCGRAVVLGRPPEAFDEPAAASAQAALEGFVRSLAKELGKRGATAQLVYVAAGAEDRLPPVLRFVLSDRSAFVTGQPIRITTEAAAPDSIPQSHPFEGKVALVTGAARGIGAATARLLAREGAHVVCLDRPQDDAPVSQVAREIDGSVLLADVASRQSPEQIASRLAGRHGGVDIVIHNAGVTRDKTLARMSPEQWDQAIEINLGAVGRITDALIAGPLRDHGRIVCLSSVAGIAGNRGQTNYAASKAGIIGFVRALAPTLARRGITVNAIAPGFIETRLTAAIPMVIREVGRRLSALGQGGKPRDVAEAIAFLSTPGASGITGRVLRVCGGAFIGA